MLLRLAWRNLWRRPWRTLLTGAGVALGLGLLLTMLGLGDGSHLQMIDAAVGMGSGHVLVQARGYQERRGVEMVIAEDAARRVAGWAREQRDVVAVLPRVFASALLSSADGAVGVALVGVDPVAEAAVSRYPAWVREGRFAALGGRGTAIIGSGVARVLHAGIGGRVVVMAQAAGEGDVRSVLLHVVGVVHTGLEDVDRGLLLVPLGSAQELLALGGGVHQVALILGDQAQSAARAAAARRAFPGLEALTWAQADPDVEAAIRLDDGGHYLFNAIFFVIIGFMVLNTLLMSVLERRREIALLGALGLTPGRRWGTVMLEGGMLAGLGIAGGLAIGLAVNAYFGIRGLPLAWFTDQPLESGGVLVEPVMYASLSVRRVVVSAALVFGLTVVLSLVAARPAARPVDAGLLK
ncbi:MAG: ABC transporter permease [Candidatus Rokubacteria bacterium]|nr:ABC transporter permease [Candidatus Rokubacteria bacterium]